MVRPKQKRKKQIFLDRFRFFSYEVALGFILIFILLLIPAFVIPLIVEPGSVLYGILFYSLRAIMTFIGVPLILHLSNLLFLDKKSNVIIEEDVSPAIGHLKLYKITKNNYQYQIVYGFLIFFLVFLPIDFLGYLLIPEFLEYQSYALAFKSTDSYLLADHSVFLISVIIIQVSVAISEETISRGLLTKRGSEHYYRMSAVMISSLYFGLGHFAYFLDPISSSYPLWFPFIMFLQTFIVGIILSLLIIRRKWLIPVIIAHALNNIVSAHAVWSFLKGVDFIEVVLQLYLPLTIIGLLMLIWQFSRIKDGLLIGLNIFKEYFEFDNTTEETNADKVFRVFIDIVLAFLIFLMGIMIVI